MYMCLLIIFLAFSALPYILVRSQQNTLIWWFCNYLYNIKILWSLKERKARNVVDSFAYYQWSSERVIWKWECREEESERVKKAYFTFYRVTLSIFLNPQASYSYCIHICTYNLDLGCHFKNKKVTWFLCVKQCIRIFYVLQYLILKVILSVRHIVVILDR